MQLYRLYTGPAARAVGLSYTSAAARTDRQACSGAGLIVEHSIGTVKLVVIASHVCSGRQCGVSWWILYAMCARAGSVVWVKLVVIVSHVCSGRQCGVSEAGGYCIPSVLGPAVWCG